MLTCSVCGLVCADILVGLLRLRKCSEDTFRPELKDGVSVVRELHVYGSVVPVNARDPSKFQHQVSCIDVILCMEISVYSAVHQKGEIDSKQLKAGHVEHLP